MAGQKILNPEIRNYIREMVIKSLESSDDFVKVYGKRFIAKKFDKNVGKIYTNEKSIGHLGYCDVGDGSITICASGKDGKKLMPQEIEQNESIKKTCLHESVHAILLQKASRAKGIKAGTGMFEVRTDGSSIGRGFNEGLTEWICEQAGFEANSYPKLTNIIRQLELALGSKQVMKMGKGNISKNITKILRMTEEDCNFFLGLGDQECAFNKNLIYLENVKIGLEGQKRDETLESIKRDPRIKGLFKREDYKREIATRGKEKEIEIVLEYIRKRAGEISNSRNKNLLRTESIIFDQYFREEFEQMKSQEIVSKEQMQKFAKLYSLMQKDPDNKQKGYLSIKFQAEFTKMKDRYLLDVTTRAVSDLQEGKLSSNQLMKYLQEVDGIGENSDNEFLNRISKAINPKYSAQLTSLLSALYKNDKLDEIYKYSIQIVKSESREEAIFFKDDKAKSIMYSPRPHTIGQEKIEECFDYTLQEDEEYKSAIDSFLKLKEQLEQADPTVKMQIVNRTIISSGKKGRRMYVIEGGQVIPAKETQQVDFQFAPNENETNLPVIAKNGLISRIRKRLFGRKIDIPGMEQETARTSNGFKSRISDMSNYSSNQIDEDMTSAVTKIMDIGEKRKEDDGR